MNIRYGVFGLSLLVGGMFLTSCQVGTKKSESNGITFDSIQVEKVYHLLDNPDNPNCDLEINFVYPKDYADKAVLEEMRKQFVYDYFGENYEGLSPEEAVERYTQDYISAYKDLEEDFKE